MKASVFIATSLDGFIARQDGALDWLPADGGEPHGYDEFIATVDALVIGRKTFETVLTFDTWPYGSKPVVVLSTKPAELWLFMEWVTLRINVTLSIRFAVSGSFSPTMICGQLEAIGL